MTPVSIPTPDGDARAFVFTPEQGAGPWPAVIMYMDGPAIRPALFEMGQRLASNGYYVLLPDTLWRLGDYGVMDPKVLFAQPDGRARMIEMITRGSSPQKIVSDSGAFLTWLDEQPAADARKVGVTGYCMGGGHALRAAAAFPEQIVAVGAFHAGRVATDAEDSPHRLAPQIKAKVLVGGADQDATFDEAQKDRLSAAFEAAGVDATVEIYPGALHGYVPSDTPVHNPEAAERHWRELLALLDETLK